MFAAGLLFTWTEFLTGWPLNFIETRERQNEISSVAGEMSGPLEPRSLNFHCSSCAASGLLYVYAGEFHNNVKRPRAVVLAAGLGAAGLNLVPTLAWFVIPKPWTISVSFLRQQRAKYTVDANLPCSLATVWVIIVNI